MIRVTILMVSALLLVALAEAQMPLPKPAPELKKLDYFVGNWTCDGDSKPGPMGPAGKMTMTEDAKWMDGGFFIVGNSSYKSSVTGNGNGISFLGYDSDAKKYTFNEFNSSGEATVSRGTVEGDTWTWIGELKPGQPMKGRFTQRILSPTSYSFSFEGSQDGNSWTSFIEGKCTKSK